MCGVLHGAAAGREHDARHLRQLVDHVPLPGAEAGLSLALEDVGDVHAGAAFDDLVAVEELELQFLGELAADGGLARAHRADQEDAVLALHGGEL